MRRVCSGVFVVCSLFSEVRFEFVGSTVCRSRIVEVRRLVFFVPLFHSVRFACYDSRQMRVFDIDECRQCNFVVLLKMFIFMDSYCMFKVNVRMYERFASHLG